MKEKEAHSILARAGALVTDSHVVYTSGKHGSAYVNKDAVYPHTGETSALCRAMAEHFKDFGVDVVAAPAVGAVILSQWVAHHLSEMMGKEVVAVYAEKEAEGFAFRRGYDAWISNRNVLVVEDILTTGGSAKKVVDLVRATGGRVLGLAVLCNRGGIEKRDVGDVPELFSLVKITLEMYDPKECPLCLTAVPINTTVGKGKEFLEKSKGVA